MCVYARLFQHLQELLATVVCNTIITALMKFPHLVAHMHINQVLWTAVLLQMDNQYEYSLIPTMDSDDFYSDRNKHQALPWEDPM